MNKFEDVFKILKKYFYETDETNIDYLCIICKNILSNAHSGPCGCRYCYECICKFLNCKENFCPGDTNECKQEKLNLNKNIHYEHSVNMRISKLIVKCPERFCQFKDEIRNIENHIRVCNFRQINCPYFNIGCKQSNLIDDDMKKHLLFDIVPHSNLLLELIENMRNEMELLKKDIGELKDENKSLKGEIETIKLERKEKMNNDEIVELNEEMVMLKNENRYLKGEIEKMKIDKTSKNMDNTIATMKMKAEQQTVDIDEIKIKLEMMENKQKEFMNKFDEISTGNAQLMRKSNENEEIMINSINSQINDLQMKILETQGEFDWKINDFSKLEKDKQIYSKPFFAFTNGYQMCLSIVVDHQFLSFIFYVYLHLMRGEFDDNLLWPCNCDVSIDLINQNNNQIYKSRKIKYNNRSNNNQIYRSFTVKYNDPSKNSGWNKPLSERNEGIFFLSLSSLNKFKNDQLLIKCRTNITKKIIFN